MTEKTINALERAIHLAEYVCSDYCDAVEITTIKNAVDIMKSQKAEIERLTINMNAYGLGMNRLSKELEIAKLEAYNEFADRLEYFVLNEDPEINDLKCKDYESYMGGANQFRLQIVKGINNLTKELTEKDTSVSLIDGHIEAEKGNQGK